MSFEDISEALGVGIFIVVAAGLAAVILLIALAVMWQD